jgi:hypothetical protein
MRPASYSPSCVVARRSLSSIVRRITRNRSSCCCSSPSVRAASASSTACSRASLSSVTVMRDPYRAKTASMSLTRAPDAHVNPYPAAVK